MNYYVSEVQIDEGVQKTAGIKARDDVEGILSRNGFEPINIEFDGEQRKKEGFQKIGAHFVVKNFWKKKVSKLKKGDTLLVQFPVINHSLLLKSVFADLKQRGVKVILLIHDLETIRAGLKTNVPMKKKFRLKMEETSILKNCDYIIVHNDKMRNYLSAMGIDADQLVSLQIFDYLIPQFQERFDTDKYDRESPVIIAGTLRKHKAGYVYALPDNICFNLYGVGYEGKTDGYVNYFGAFLPDDLPFSMEGSFGLVWDGESSDTCTGIYGDYLKLNNPHKASLYLSSGIPVVIWEKAALAEFISKNGCGIVVSSIADISERVSEITDEEYSDMKKNALRISEQMRNGEFLMNAIRKCE